MPTIDRIPSAPPLAPDPAAAIHIVPLRRRLSGVWSRLASVNLAAAAWAWIRHNRLLTCAILLMFPIGIAFQHRCPYLNGPDEWRWHYMDLFDFWLTWIPALALAAVGFGVVFGPLWAVAPRLAPTARRRAALAGLAVFGLYYHWLAFALASPGGFTHIGLTITLGPATGYFSDAEKIGHSLPELPDLLRRYAEFIPQFGNHAQSHPPGAVVACHGVIRFFELHPDATRAALRAYQALGLDLKSYFAGVAPSHIAAAATLGSLLALLGVLGALPLFALVRRALAGRPEAEPVAWGAAWLWVVHPPLIFFEPQFDQAYAGLITCCLYCALRGLRTRRRPALWGAAAGVLFMMAVCFSFTFLMVAPMLLAVAALELARRAGSWRPGRIACEARWANPGGRRLWAMIAACLAACFVFNGVLAWGWGIRLFKIFLAARHEVLYVHIPTLQRHYRVWVYFNLHDFIFFAGTALAVLALAYCARMAREGWRSPVALPPIWAAYPLTVLLIDLLGLTPAETGRIWLFLAPGLAWAGAAELVRRAGGRWKASLAVLLIAQMAFYYLCRTKMKFIGW